MLFLQRVKRVKSLFQTQQHGTEILMQVAHGVGTGANGMDKRQSDSSSLVWSFVVAHQIRISKVDALLFSSLPHFGGPTLNFFWRLQPFARSAELRHISAVTCMRESSSTDEFVDFYLVSAVRTGARMQATRSRSSHCHRTSWRSI